jgi:hypothetical protein
VLKYVKLSLLVNHQKQHLKEVNMQYLILFPDDDEAIKRCMAKWLSEAGGRLPLAGVKNLLRKRFNFVNCAIMSEEKARRKGLTGNVYKLQNGMVLRR